MRLRRLHALSFGPLRDCRLELRGDIVLVYGPNESGKSSFRTAVETVLYGFEPARRESHPLYQWNEAGGNLHLEADLSMDDGSALRVERVLQAKASSRIAGAGEAFTGSRQGNAPLPAVGGLPRKLFLSIYSIEIDQLTALEAGVQEHVDDLLLPEVVSLELLPVSQIRERLRADHQRLWRPTRQGNQRIRDLERELTDARRAAQTAENAEQELRGAVVERARLEQQLVDDRKERTRLERSERDAEYLGHLFDLNQRRRSLGEPIDPAALGGFKLEDPEEIERRGRSAREALRIPRERLARDAAVLAEHHGAVLAAEPQLRAAVEAVTSHAVEVERRADAAGRAAGLRQRADEALTGVLEAPLGAAGALPDRLPVARLRALQETWSRAWRQQLAVPAPEAAPRWPLSLTAAGLAFVAVGFLVGAQPWTSPGGLALLAGLVLLAGSGVAMFAARSVPPRRPATAPARPEALEATLAGLPVAETFLDGPAELQRLLEVLSEVERLRGEAAGLEREAEEADAGIRAREEGWRSLCRRLGLDAAGEAAVLIQRLCLALEAAQAAAAAVELDARERSDCESQLERLGPALEENRRHRAAVQQFLEQAAPGAASPADAYEQVCERARHWDYLRTRQQELAADPRWHRWREDPRVTGESAPADADWHPEIAASRAARLEELNATLETAGRQLGELDNQLREDPGSRAARARDAVQALEEELSETRRRRDRLALLDSIVCRSEQIFRDEHQPDVLRRASHYLERVSNGRYHRLDYVEGEQGGLHVSGGGRGEPTSVGHPISRGTLDQIFLCLRLGLLDHLDQQREKLPLLLDDALLRMDDVRRQNLYRLLAGIAPTRQIFFLTCHANIAAEAEAALKATRIDLANPQETP